MKTLIKSIEFKREGKETIKAEIFRVNENSLTFFDALIKNNDLQDKWLTELTGLGFETANGAETTLINELTRFYDYERQVK